MRCNILRFTKIIIYIDLEQNMSLIYLLKIVSSFALLYAFAIMFKPLLTGAYRALKMIVKPNMSREQRLARAYYRNAMTLHSMTSASEALSPNLAAELRALSGRG